MITLTDHEWRIVAGYCRSLTYYPAHRFADSICAYIRWRDTDNDWRGESYRLGYPLHRWPVAIACDDCRRQLIADALANHTDLAHAIRVIE